MEKERLFELIDGNFAKGISIDAYCSHYHAFLTEPLIKTHNCKHKKNGRKCPMLGFFNYQYRIPKDDGKD